jgi:hypothetical protein
MTQKIVPFALIALIGLWAQTAFAYIDPGSGSAIMSAIIGLFVAGGLFVKSYWYKLKSIFSSAKKNESKDVDSQGDSTEKP